MNNSEAVDKLRAYLKCQKNKVKGINAMCTHNMCDNCDLCYMQGTTGEHLTSIELAIQALEKLKDYEDLEEQGRLVKLPCKVRDIVYVVIPGCERVNECKVITVNYSNTATSGNVFYIEALPTTGSRAVIGFYNKEFGKTVFLTKSEAEVKLKELRGEEHE